MPRCLLLGGFHPVNPVDPGQRGRARPGRPCGRTSVQEHLEVIGQCRIGLLIQLGQREQRIASRRQCFLPDDAGWDDEPMPELAIGLHPRIEMTCADGHAGRHPAASQMGSAHFGWNRGERERPARRDEDRAAKRGRLLLVNPVLILIPRAIYPGKPDSLANEFLERKYGRNKTIGFAYNPVTESFVNFGYVGSFLVFFLLGRFLVFLSNYKNQVFNFLIFITLIDFCRGEMGTYLYQLLFVSIFLLLHRKKK